MSSLRDALSEAMAAQEAPDEPQVEAAAPPEPVEQAQPAQETQEARSERLRDPQGKFAKAEQAQTEPTEPAPPPVRKAPSSWKPAAQEAFLKADRGEALTGEEIRLLTQEAERRESDFHKGLEQFKGHSERAQAYDQAVSPYRPYLEQLGVDAPTAVSYLLKTEYALRNGDPAVKAQIFQKMAQDYGIDLGQLAQMPAPDPQQQYLMQQLQELRHQQMAWQNQLQQQEQTRAQAQIGEFAAADKPHFDAVRGDMADLLESGKAKTLQDAYEMAVWMRQDTRQTLLDQQRAEAQKKALEQAQAQKAKAAAVSVKGSGAASSGVQPVKGSLRDMIAAQFDN